MMYWIVNDLIAIPAKPHRQAAIRSAHKFVQPATFIDCYKHFSFPSAVRIWNSIPSNAALSSTIDSFKAAVGSLGLTKA